MTRGKTRIIDVFNDAVRAQEMQIVEEVIIPTRPEQRKKLPKKLLNSAIGRFLTSTRFPDETAWLHQSMSLDSFLKGRDIAVTTSTASGKSMIFQTAGVHLLEKDPDARIIAMYPLKALAADQIPDWQTMLEGAGLDPNLICEITGDTPWSSRAHILDKARVAVMTPDVVHSWMMSNLDNPMVRKFVGNLRLEILDETHVLESVFGSSTAFLLRRLESASALAAARMGKKSHIQYIATSATIDKPAEHLKELTGRDFSVIDDMDDGSPRHGRRVIHLAPKVAGALDLVGLQRDLLDRSDDGSLISFVDSRSGTERLARSSGAGVVAYRNGYSHFDRRRLENKLKVGAIRAVMSTSALEMGVNMGAFEVGFNLGVPDSRRSLHQRIGRVGRTGPGVFAVVAEANEFQKFGETFRDFVEGEIEPSSLYLGNRFLQYAHARCLLEELRSIGAKRPTLPRNVDWPEGFADIFAMVASDQPVPASFGKIHKLGGHRPHTCYPLRDMMDRVYGIGMDSKEKLASSTHRSALIEAYPGAIYLHMGKAYEVRSWGTNQHGAPTIKVVPKSTKKLTKPILNTYVNTDLDTAILDGNFRAGKTGFMAECKLRVVEKVEGFVRDDKRVLYSELSKRDPSKTTKSRAYETTGVVICLNSDIGGDKAARDEIAKALVAKLKRAEAIAGGDIDFTTSNITIDMPGAVVRADNVIVIFDRTYGSLRFTEALFGKFDSYVDDMVKGGLLSETGHGVLPERFLKELANWSRQVVPAADLEARNVVMRSFGMSFEPKTALRSGTLFEHQQEMWAVHEPCQIYKDGEITDQYRVRRASGEKGYGFVLPENISLPVDVRDYVAWDIATSQPMIEEDLELGEEMRYGT